MSRKQRARSPGRPKANESDEVIEAILLATIAELRHGGFHGLTFERVARRAGVAKTTVYRRWPTTSKLVLAAWLSMRRKHDRATPVTGDLEKDLVKLLEQRARRMETPEGKSLAQALINRDDDDTVALARKLQTTGGEAIRDLLRGAIARGEVRHDLDCELAAEALAAVLTQRYLLLRGRLRRAEIQRVVALFLRGARSSKARHGRLRR